MIVFLFLFGLIIGSFLNVVIFRFNTGMGVAKGRSVCLNCNKTLAWYELLPLGSFLIQKGRCRGCSSRLSWQYPLVEIMGGVAFVLAYLRDPNAYVSVLGLTTSLLFVVLMCLYIVIVVYDLRHKIIPDAFSYAASLVALGLIGVDWATVGHVDFLRVIAGPTLFIFFWFFWFVSKGTWMGLGDGKLALSIGWSLGLAQGIAATLFSFWIGALISVSIMIFQTLHSRKKRRGARLGMKSQIPFGPFLVLGFLIAFMCGVDIQAILAHLAL